jgi:hypothetical protein
MTIHSFHTSEPDEKAQATKEEQRLGARQAILNDIARNAVVEDEFTEPIGINIELDPMGNVIVKEHEVAADGTATANTQKRIFHVPQEEAYQRIVEAAQSKIALLEHLYESSRAESNRWFTRSLLGAASEALIITFSILAPIFLQVLRETQHIIPFAGLIFSINTLNIGLMLWISRKSRLANAQVDLYLHNLHEVRNFSTVTHFLARLQLDTRQKQLLQTALVSRSLGLTEPDLGTRTARDHKDPPYRTEPL